MMTPAPTITTKRLTLRGPIESDLAPYSGFIVNASRMVALGGTAGVTITQVAA